MSALSEQIVGYYQNLLIAQYANKPKAVATVAALLGGSDSNSGLVAGAIYNAVRDGFDLTTAVGKQLDFLGELIGVSRYVSTLDLSKTFMQITTYGAPDMGTVNGLATYETTPQPPSWYFMTYEDFVGQTLLDGDYRRVLMFLASVQGCDYAYETLDSILYTWFGGNVNLIVTGSMAVTYQHLTTDTDNLFEILNQMGLLPTPAGYTVTVSEVGSF